MLIPSQASINMERISGHASSSSVHDTYGTRKPSNMERAFLAPKHPTDAVRPPLHPIQPVPKPYASFIKPATGAFGQPPVPILKESAPPKVDSDENGETFNIDAIPITAEDYAIYRGDTEQHMRELLSGAIGDGEGMEDAPEGSDIVDGFANQVRLMPHQVRGVRWMRQRESGRKYGGILADDMGLGKTIQALACIAMGPCTVAEKKAGYKHGTLIVAPLAVIEQWASEVRSKTNLKAVVYHGPGRLKLANKLDRYDIVITTFQTLASEHGVAKPMPAKPADSSDSESSKPKAVSNALFQVKWLRVVIDEAQNIKNKSTKAAKAAVGLLAKYRWCLTGTPIQNNVEELYSLFQFLRAKPLDDWEVFRQRISSLIKRGQVALAMKRLHVVLKAVMLRRTKDATIDGKPILNLPPRILNIVPCEFDSEERAFYDALETKTTLTFNKFLKSGTAMANYTSILTLLLRLRQACDHPTLVTKSYAVDRDAIQNDFKEETDSLAELLGGLGVGSKNKCTVCFAEISEGTQCPECEALTKPLATSELPPTSAKIRKLLELVAMIEERSGKKEKIIVFSQFTSFLDLVQPFLKSAAIAHVRYDGSMRNDKRQAALDAIRTDPNIRLILISFKAGSTGLNLVAANHVLLLDPWWNPSLEDQAFDRAHRLGQTLPVSIYKLTIAKTVEDRILELQNSKRELAKAALSGGEVKSMRLTMADMMKLFRSDY